jgi:hypothetical protein
MSDKKVKISNILGSQIPDFIQADNPLFKEFLTQYYESEEREYGTTYLADHISSLKKIPTVADISLVKKQTVNVPGTASPESPVLISSFLYAYDDVINVNQTTGFPDKYGLLKIDNEIITYTGKTATSFTGCIRGFSGISEIETVSNPEFLTFSDTNADAHDENSTVTNLSFLFVTEFYKKFRKHFLPGLEGRDFSYGINVENILSRARDFYSSKGTDTSLQILFQVLYGKQIDVIKPFDQTIMPSEAEYDVSDNIIVEVLFGNPLNLVGVKIYQDSFTNPTASGAVSNVNTKFLGNKKYYEISFSKGTIIDKLKVSTKTKVIGAASTTEVLTVDSTIGFGETGNFYYPNEDNIYTLAEYTSKSSNQFFGCTGVSRLLTESESIIDTNFVYGYENNDLTKICTMRIVGTISGASDNKDSTKYFDFDDLIRVKHLGEKYDVSDKKFNTWFYNNISYVDALGHVADGDTINDSAADRTFTTSTEHFLKIGDRVDIFFKESGVKFRENSEVSVVNNEKQIQIDGGIINTKIISGDYVIKKRLNYTSSNFGITNLLSNIQNSFSDKDKNTYVSFSGYPSFDTQTTNRSHVFQSSAINANTITINDHNFINGEKVYLSLSLDSGLSEGSSGYYYVNVINNNNFKLSTSYPNLYNSVFETITWSGVGSGEHTITPASLYIGQKLSNQNNLRRIYKNPQVSKNNSRIIGAIGISLNGVEYHSPISNESVYYGQIDELQVTNSGENFDVINPPTLLITDKNGTNCETIVNFSGQPTKVILNKSGFDYLNTPSVRIVGGNGTGAVCKAKMRGFNYSRSYTDFNVDLTTNRITGEHRFSDGEEVRYIATGTPIGITTGVNVGFNTDRLTSGTSYFIAKYDNNSFGLAINEDRALTKTNLLDLFDFGNQVHTFESQKVRNIIDRIEITNTGSSYDNHRVEIPSQLYPPINLKDVFKTFVGINTFNDYVYAKNHNFKNGDIVDYICSGTVISGLSTSIPYQITVIDNDKFKLSSAGTATTISNTNYERKIYEKLSSIGVGTHTFKYPNIRVEINGQISAGTTSTIPDYYKASADVEVRGGLKNIFVKNGGVGYGVTNIVNYLKKPKISLLTGKNAFLTPNVVNGKVESVSIGNGGSEYTSPPILEVVEVGKAIGTIGAVAELKAVVSDGKITDVKIIKKGSKYNPNNTIIRITPSGSKSIITTKIHEWKINAVERYDHVLTENNSQFVQINSESLDYNNKICSFYPVKKYRRLLRDNIDSNLIEFVDDHSKIVGWAYDGNPIYGPVGVNTSGITTYMQSSYQLDIIADSGLRPSTYQNGYFIQDYVYKGNGDLDEFNGTFLINSDFPEGTYAYFSTLNNTSKNPSFPYISFQHRNATDNFNYNLNSKQIDKVINSGEYKRNVTHLGLNDEFRRYPVLNDSLESKALVKIDGVKDSRITKVSVDGSGTGYKVNDRIIFNDPSITSSVDQVIGKKIVSVGTTNTIINNLIFSVLDDQVTGFSTIPHGLSAGDIVEISGISSTLYKNIEGVQTIGVTTTTASLSQAIGNAATTGITTFISLSSPTLNRKFEVDDVFQIGSEQFLVIDHDDVNNKYRVRRGYNSSGNTTHSAGTIVNKLETKFTYPISKKVENINVQFPKIEYFEGTSSIGIGTSVSNVIVGQVGITSIYKSIPAKAIYLPNHKFQNGDEVKLISIGSTINATRNADLSNPFDLSSFDKLFCTRFNSEFIGLATEKTGIGTLGISTTSQNVFFKEVLTTGGDDNKLELLTNNVFGSLRKVNGTVTVATSATTGQHHALSVGDEFELHLTTNKTQTFNLKYNESIQKLVVNPLSFIDSAIGIGTTMSTITINDHDFQTGDLVVYNSTTPADPLVNDGVYYVIKESRDTIRLAENAYDLSIFPYNYIGIGTTGGTNHEISKINPKLSFYKNNTVELVTTDSSLDDFSIEFYEDKNLKSKYNSNLITKTSDKITISVTDLLAQEFFYKIEGKKTNLHKTLSFPVDERVPNHSQIVLVESKFNDKFKVVGISSDTFKFNATGIAETTSYTSTGLSTSFYSTSSINEIGGIHSVNVLNKGFNVRKLPLITSIGTTDGLNSVLTVEADDIGKIESTQVINQGLEFSPDNTLKPKADSNVLLKLKNVLTLDSIGITSGGVNYTNPPSVLVIGKPNILAQTTISGTSVNSVKILTNDSGLSEDVRIIPITNSNGVVVTGADTDALGTVTLSLRAPNPESGSESGFYNSGGDFPFAVNDEIFVENIKTTDNPNGGYNSSDYNYTYFKVTGIGTTGGGETVSYSLVGLGSTGGTYQEDNNFGRVIKKDNLAVFKAIFKETVFSDDEIVRVDGKNVSGIVARNGWDPISETLKVFSTNGDFSPNDKIVGSISNNKGTVTEQFKFDFDLDVDSLANINNSWKTNIGKLNSDIQKLHDNHYYQRFSYSIKGEVPYNTWKDAVNSLDHVAGFKNFSNLGISTVGIQTIKSDSEVVLNVDVDQEASVNERYYYDMASEDTNDPELSKLIVLKSKIITDYNESRTNKVLLIDDISSQFTGIVTSIGGGVIGTTSFNVFADGNSLFHREFNPSTGVSTVTHKINLPKHNFNTGEELVYKPHTGQSPIGIANTSDVNAGVAATTLLPSTVFVIREDPDIIKVAISATFASAGIAVSFTNVVGIANTNILSVPSENATIRSLITVDNIIQSPIGITTAISVGLTTEVGISTTILFLNDTSEISGKSLLKIEDEIIKVSIVGLGTTTLNVERGQMGTVAVAHTVGAAVTVVKGDYRINEGRIYFSEAPYGPAGIGTLTTKSTFSGRAYYRLTYDTNKIIDDISDRFDGSTDQFKMTTNGNELLGISSSFGAVLINNIFQKPFFGDVGDINKSDYQIIGAGSSIDFTGTSANKDLPRGGIINEFDVGIGSGYQVPKKAILTAVVSAGGTIQSVGIASGGAGYLSNPLVSVSSTTGVGAAISAFVTAGIVTSVTITNPGSGYAQGGISTGINFVTTELPSPYKNIPLSGGNGSGATMDVVVGTGGSILSFDIADRGVGYEIGDNLQLTTLPFQVGIGTSAFNITVKNKFQDKFAGWCFGQLLELDDFSIQFNGSRKSFLITRTIKDKEYYSIVAQEGSGIILQNNLLIFINDILQRPGLDYEFEGGTRITFKEPPKPGSLFKMYFYTGSTSDFVEVDVDETIKPGDELRLHYFNQSNVNSSISSGIRTESVITLEKKSEQDNRVVYELIAADTVETTTYSGVGISTNADFARPMMWRKQTQDLIIDGVSISKERNYLEPDIVPTSGIIKSISPTDSKIYVKDSWMFKKVDDLGQTLNNINIVGLGTTAVVETIEKVTYEGDYGVVVGIGTSLVGINTTGPALFFEIVPHENIYDPDGIPNGSEQDKRSKSGISTGDYFVIENTFIGNGITGIKTTSSGPETVGVGNSFLNNVYFAEDYVSVGSSMIRVFANVNSIAGIDTTTLTTKVKYGTYSWGSINVSRSANSKSFTFHNQNGVVGIETSAQVIRTIPIKTSYT